MLMSDLYIKELFGDAWGRFDVYIDLTDRYKGIVNSDGGPDTSSSE